MKITISKVARSSVVGSSLMVHDDTGRCVAVLAILNAGDNAESIAEQIVAMSAADICTPSHDGYSEDEYQRGAQADFESHVQDLRRAREWE